MSHPEQEPLSILIVDDDDAFRETTARLLAPRGFHCHEAVSADQALSCLHQTSGIAAVLCDIRMPGKSGLELLPVLAADFPGLAVVMTTGVDDPSTAELAFSVGADGYLVKPITTNELVITLTNALRRRRLESVRQDELRGLETQLARIGALARVVRGLESSTDDVSDELDTIERLSRAVSLRDEETGRHLERMSILSGRLAEVIGHSEGSVYTVRLATLLHDVGKIGVPDTILLKPGPLSLDEYAAMKRHAQLGYQLLAGSTSELLEAAAEVALGHHEWWDGGGYPRGSRGDQIPEVARIAAVADVFDALTSHRVYRPALPVDEAIALMADLRGRQFEPRLLDAFLELRDELIQIREAFPDVEDQARIRVLLVDDHEMLVESLGRLLGAESTIKVVGAARNLEEGYNSAAAYQPDVVLMDFDLPDGDGVDAARRITVMYPDIKVVMLTGRADRDAYVRAIDAGCAGFVNKTDPLDTLLTTIHAAHDGESLPPVADLRLILSRLDPTRRGLGSGLSARELEVLRLLAAGLPNKLIARRLHISANTVGNHVRSVLYKLNAHSRLEAVAVAVREGVIGREDAAADA